MTREEITTLIKETPSLMSLVPDTAAIAEEICRTKTKYVPTEIGVGTILEVLGVSAGNSLLDILYSSQDFRYVKPLLEQGRLRLDSAFVVSTIEQFVTAGILTEDQKESLLSTARQPETVTEFEVRVAIYNDDGTMRV